MLSRRPTPNRATSWTAKAATETTAQAATLCLLPPLLSFRTASKLVEYKIVVLCGRLVTS